jgi:omega-hydroxy-beta-dihydromenaquinone-9 sulfotransferase
MREDVLAEPIFVIGAPRSGTTIVFEALARHPHLAWPSNYCRLFPRALWVNAVRAVLDNRLIGLYGRKEQYGPVPPLNAWLPQPDEAYEFWDLYSGVPFSRHTLNGVRCDASARSRLRGAAASVVEWQRRRRFSAKLTGPPRIEFLESAFPGARFVHVIRDGRAVSHSLLRVRFWRSKGGLEEPFWHDLLPSGDLGLWERAGRDPGVLAALQWKRIIELARHEAATLPPERYLEVKYEAFTSAPHEILAGLINALGLPDDAAIHRSLDEGPSLENMNAKFRSDFDTEALASITSVMEPLLGELGYE